MRAGVALCIGVAALAAPASGFAQPSATHTGVFDPVRVGWAARPPRVGWAAPGYARLTWEFSAGPAVALDVDRGAPYVGASLRCAWLPSAYFPIEYPDLIEFFAGDTFGIELRAQMLVGVGDASTLVVAGLAPVVMNAVGDRERGKSRFRVPTVFGALVPELGVAVVAGDPRFYLRWELPFSVLLTNRVAFEARPSITLIDGVAPTGSAGVLAAISLGVLLR